MTENQDVCIAVHFRQGLSVAEICVILQTQHGITVSQRTVRRRLSLMKLFRRKNFTDDFEIASFLRHQMQSSGQMHGYKWMHLKCIQRGYTVTQETVRQLLLVLDPMGVAIRQRRRLRRRVYFAAGPDEVWHMDGYDKLKPYGIAIHGCIDGYSRYIVWMHAYTTNNDPHVIASYFTNAVGQTGGCPMKVRADMGTENVIVEQLQTFLRNDQNAFMYGRSVNNQRIEAWWGILRRECAQFWINVFEEIKDEYFTGSFLDKSLVQFCFLYLIQVSIISKCLSI